MKVLRRFFVFAVFTLAGSGASAQVLDDETRCETIQKFISVPSPDKGKVEAAVNYIIQVMQGVDRAHGRRGDVEILQAMTVEGRSALALIVTDRCLTRSHLTVADTAIETYEAIRSMKFSLGFAKVRQRWVWRHRTPQTHVPRQMSASRSNSELE